MIELWGLAHSLEDLGFKTLKEFLDRDKAYELDRSMKPVFNPVVDWTDTPATDRDAVKHEIELHLVEMGVRKECLEGAVKSIENEMHALKNYRAEIIEREEAEAQAEAEDEFKAEMEKKETDRRDNIDESELNRWRESKIKRGWSDAQPVKEGDEIREYDRKDVANGEIYETLDWVAFIDIWPLEESYNNTHTNRFEVNYGLIPSPENFLNHKRNAHRSKPLYRKTSKRFKTEEETKEFYAKTKERLEKELGRKVTA